MIRKTVILSMIAMSFVIFSCIDNKPKEEDKIVMKKVLDKDVKILISLITWKTFPIHPENHLWRKF